MTKPIEITSGGKPFDFEDEFKDVLDVAVISSAQGLDDTMDQIGFRIAQRYQRDSGGRTAKQLPPIPGRWTTRTGRLLRSYLSKGKVELNQFPGSRRTKRVVRGSAPSGIKRRIQAARRGTRTEAIRDIKYDRGSKQIIGEYGSKVPYAAVLEFEEPWKRPAVIPAVNDVEPTIDNLIKKRMDIAYKKLGYKGN